MTKGWTGPQGEPPSHPVTGISWFEALAYSRWLSAQTGLAFRLPTEAEYEAAARRRYGDQSLRGRHGMPCFNGTNAHIGGKEPAELFRVIRGSFFAGHEFAWERLGAAQDFHEDTVGMGLALHRTEK